MNRLEQHWYRPVWWMTALLALPEGLFALLAALRRLLYRCGLKTVTTLPVQGHGLGSGFRGYRLHPPVRGFLWQRDGRWDLLWVLGGAFEKWKYARPRCRDHRRSGSTPRMPIRTNGVNNKCQAGGWL